MFKVGEGIAGIQVATFDDTISSDAVKHSLDVSSKVTQQFIAKGKDVGGTFEVGIGTAGVSVVKQTAAPLQSSEDRGTAVKKTPEDAVDETDCYDMKRSPHGTVLIINNESFRSPCLSKRDGTAADVSSLQGLFRQLGFRCDTKKDIHNNVTAESMKKLVKKYAGGDHSKHDAAIVCILSHGQNNTVYGVDGKEVRLDELVTSFYRKNAPTLNGKPKLFFIQACRGHGRDTSDVTEDDRADCTSDDGYLECGMVYGSPIGLQDADDSEGGLPETADILLAYSAYKGFRSYRHTVKGSYFVQTLCDVFGHQYSRSHVTEMLRHVKSRVAEDVKACGHYKMMPVTEESMRKKLYFCPT